MKKYIILIYSGILIAQIQVDNSLDNHSPKIQIAIHDRTDKAVCIVDAINMLDKPYKINKSGIFSFTINNCRLIPGYYSVKLGYKSSGSNLVADVINDAVSFHILSSNDPKSSFNNNSVIVAEGNWDLELL